MDVVVAVVEECMLHMEVVVAGKVEEHYIVVAVGKVGVGCLDLQVDKDHQGNIPKRYKERDHLLGSRRM